MGRGFISKQPSVKKWVILDKNGKVVIITRNKSIALGYAKWRAENDRVR